MSKKQRQLLQLNKQRRILTKLNMATTSTLRAISSHLFRRASIAKKGKSSYGLEFKVQMIISFEFQASRPLPGVVLGC